MKTKLFTLFLALVASVGTMFAWDYEHVQIDDLYYNLDATNKTAEVTSSGNDEGYSGNITIPAAVTYNAGTYSVTSIGYYAFGYCFGLTSITIPNSVTSIGERAFRYCTGLTSITIPNSVKSIGENAFSDVLNVVYSGTATGSPWGARCFNGYVEGWLVYSDNTKTTLIACSTSATGEIRIPNSVTNIGAGAFSSCSGLTSIEISNSVTNIGEEAFSGCIGLTSIDIPNNVTNIGEEAFSMVPNVVYSGTATGSPWGARCFNGYVEGWLVYSDNTKTTLLACSAASTGEISIPNSVTSIGDKAFYWCYGLTSIDIPNGVTSIGDMAFGYCFGLTSITIPNSVTSIGESAFSDCSGLTSVTIGNGVTNIGDRAFWGCAGLTSMTIPNSVTSIGDYAFRDCTGLTSVIIGNGVTNIGDRAFDGDRNLTSVIWNAKNYSNRVSCFSTLVKSFVFGNEVEIIPDYICAGMDKLTSIIIPNSVTRIGWAAFYECKGLTSIDIPNGVTSIGWEAFWGCAGLTSVTIGNGVTSISVRAFYGCTGLTSITCEAMNPPTVYEDQVSTFSGVDEAIPLYVLAGSVDAYKVADGWNYFKNILPISAKGTEVETPTVEPEMTSAEIAWPTVTGAASYELVIKDANGNIICVLTFNAQGQLTSIAFNAPGRNAAQQTQSAGFAFTVTGLEPGTQYSYSITAKNASGATLNTETGTFTTKIPQALDQINQQPSVKSQKLIKDGHVFILRGDHTYTLTGQEVK